MRSVALLLVLTVITATLAEDDIEIEILDLFGVVTNKAGFSLNVTCKLTNPGQDDSISWFLGGKPLVNKNRVVYESGSRSLEQSYNLVLDISMDNQDLACTCRDVKDALKLSVYDYDIPDKVIFPTLLHEGDSATLQVGIMIYPPPKDGDVHWEIKKPSGETITSLEPGQNDMYGSIEALKPIISGIPSTNYIYKLLISSISRVDASNRHFLKISQLGISHTVEFSISVQLQDEKDGLEGDEPSEEDTLNDTTSALGTGILILLVVLAVGIAIVISIIIYKRSQNKKNPKVTRPNEYSAVSRDEDQVKKENNQV